MPPKMKPQPTDHAGMKAPIESTSRIRKAPPALAMPQKQSPVGKSGGGDEVAIKSPPAIDADSEMAPKVSLQPVVVVNGRTISQKYAMLLELIHRREGATLDELGAASGWQKHSVRGFIAGFVKKTLGLKVLSTRTAEGARCYHITTEAGDAAA